MPQNDISRIMVGNTPVGILGLKATLEGFAQDYRDRPDQEIIELLLSELGRRNYIAESSRKEYGKAFLKEFRKFRGEPVTDENVEGIQVKVLGIGCPQCDRLEQELMGVMNEIGIVADMEHIRDPEEIGRYGVMGTPALVINGQVKSVGSVPPRSKLITWLREA